MIHPQRLPWMVLPLAVVFLTAAGPTWADETKPATPKPSREEGIAFFEKKIRPLLAEHCVECHGEKTQESGLRLDTWAGIRDGGGSGRAIIPGEPNRGLLLAAVGYQDVSLQMPPDGRLPDESIAALRQWIAWGAPHPDGGDSPAPRPRPSSAAEPLWGLKPLADTLPPEVRDVAWPRSPLDHFILAELERAGIPPAPEADRRTWLRRVTLDLLGLPPTPEEVDAFLSDQRPDAYERVADRLLASPRYGERWGRHWLDVARYADSNGSDENIAHGNAWRYRDYVIAAFNGDKPYGEFLREQIAGDLLESDTPHRRRERLVATGFLALGPKVLAEVDETKMEMDIIDEQVDTFGQAVLGLTLGCARCHDHKFDPISTADYYALAGVFKSTRTMEHFKKIARWHESDISLPPEKSLREEFEQKVAAKKQEIESRTNEAKAELQAKLGEGAALPEKPEEQFSEQAKQDLARLKEELKAAEAAVPQPPTAMGVIEGTAADLPIHLRGSHLSLGEVVPRGIPVSIGGAAAPEIPDGGSGRRQLADWLADSDNALVHRVMANRVWRWHFGRGLVATPDNFGRLGELPSHPGLLDWLAGRLAANGSLKSLHRELVLSSTYRMSGVASGAALERDPDNRLYSRAPLQRMEAEVIRDSLLAVSGLADFSMGGSMLHVKNREFFFDHTSKDTTSYDTTRRSIYLPVVRNHLYEVFQLFDYNDAAVETGNRAATTVATQSLFLMNGDLTARAAAGLAARVSAEPEASTGVDQLFRLAYGRSPDELERADALSFLAMMREKFASESTDAAAAEGEPSAEQRAWQALCQAVLMSNEFLYIR